MELEFKILKQTMSDAIILPFEEEILALVKKFMDSGQSGGSAPYTWNWSPANMLNNPSIQNPTTTNLSSNQIYYLCYLMRERY